MVLAVADNGVGSPTNFDYHQAGTLGLVLVTALVEKLSGKLELDRSSGALFRGCVA